MLVFLHGFLGSCKDWEPLFQYMPSDIPYKAIDLPGHGNAPFTEDILGAVKKELDACHARSLVGYSAGGRLALALKDRFPKEFEKIIVLSGHPGINSAKDRASRFAQDQLWAEKLRTLSIDSFLKLWYDQPIFASLHKKKKLLEPVAKLHGSEKSMILAPVERPGNAWPIRIDGCLPKRAGEEMRSQQGPKGRFCTPWSLATGSLEQILIQRAKQDPIALASFLEAFSVGRLSPPALYPETLFLYGEEDLKYRSIYLTLPSFVNVQEIAGSGHVLHLENPKRCSDAIVHFLQNSVARS